MNDLDMFTKISEVEYQRLLKTYGDEAGVIPTMNILTIKEGKENHPIQAKSRIVVLGNHEKRIWTRKDDMLRYFQLLPPDC